MVGLINGKKELDLPWRGNFVIMSKKQTSLAEIATQMRQVLAQFTAFYRKLIDERLEESQRLNKTINLMPENFNPKLVDLILGLWNDDSIR